LDPVSYISLFSAPLYVYCSALKVNWIHLDALVSDPPDASVFTVALPAVQAPAGAKGRCRLKRGTCRQGRRLAHAFMHAFEQEEAALGALATTLDRLSSTPSGPESQFGTGAGSAPLYSRRTQVAAGRLYSGLLAAWSDRYKVARKSFVHFLDGLGSRKARRAAANLAPVLPSAPLWATFHRMNLFEAAQLFSDLTAQNVSGQRPGGRLGAELYAGYMTLQDDMYHLYQGTGGPRRTSARRILAAATKFKRDADKFASIPGLAAIAPNAPLSARLFGFAVEGLTNRKPSPVTAP
jgi:hypothetical protein